MSISRPLPAAERSALECFLAEFEVQSLDPTLEDWLRLLQVCDLLSLQLLTAGKMNLNLMSNQGIEARFDTSTESLLLSPFPFDSPLKLECPARFLTADSRIPVQSDPLRFKVCAAANHGGYGCTDGRL